MSPHLFRLIWNRKRASALVVLEIFISFVVVFAVAAAVAIAANNYRQPLGFDYRDVLTLMVEVPGSEEERSARLENVMAAVRTTPGVRNAAWVLFEPYFEGRNTGQWDAGGRPVRFDRNYVGEGFDEVMGLRVVQGRFFGREDTGAAYEPVVLDRDFARAQFGGENPIGQIFDSQHNPPQRVIGVVEEFRAQGELSQRTNYVLIPAVPGVDAKRIVVKMEPGVYSPQFEHDLLRQLERVAPGGAFQAKLLARQREAALRLWSTPVLVAAVVGLFLILMVALGLTGVMWQNVTQRTRELGLRRAVGAERQKVRQQILIEICFIATLGLILGVAVVIQVPLLGIFTFLETGVFVAALLAALTLIYGLAVACGLYPSWLASRIEPAQALHYE